VEALVDGLVGIEKLCHVDPRTYVTPAAPRARRAQLDESLQPTVGGHVRGGSGSMEPAARG
jgi:hypothetical protein